MRRHVPALLLVGALLTGCSDLHYLRKAEAAYIIQESRHEAACVNIPQERGPEWCPAREAQLRSYYLEIRAFLSALLEGPLPAAETDAIKAITEELSKPFPPPEPTPRPIGPPITPKPTITGTRGR